MKAKAIAVVIAVISVLSLGAAMVMAPATADTATNRTKGATTDHNPFNGGFEGYCTWGAQEQIHAHTGYYVTALTGNA
jgi:NADH:ubiquinone oxidoreductase subunit 3 (subunit A)